MSINVRRVGMAVAVLSVVLVAAIGPAWANGFPTYAPGWWSNPEGGSSNLRACWYDWDGSWIVDNRGTFDPADDITRGMEPDDFDIDFTVHPSWYEWEWTHEGKVRSNVHEGLGIRIPKATGDWEIDMVLGNRQLHPYKLWYIEFGITEVDTDGIPGNSIQELFDLNKWNITLEAYNKPVGAPQYEVDVVEEEAPQTVWTPDNPDTPDVDESMMVWYATYRIEPQPDMDKVTWHFFTNGDPSTSIKEDLYMRYMNTGTTCTPEPVTVALLALGLPLGLLARRRKRE